MKLDKNDLAFLDEPDYKEYKILRIKSSKPRSARNIKGDYSHWRSCILYVFINLVSGCTIWYLLGGKGAVQEITTFLWVLFAIVAAYVLVIVLTLVFASIAKIFHGKKKKRLKSLEATYSSIETEIQKKIETYVKQTSPTLGQGLLASTSKGNTLEESEIKAFSENLNAYKDNIEYVTRANQAFINDTSIVSYLEHAKMISDKADRLLSSSQQFVPSEKKTGKKIETEETHNLKDENRLVEEQYPKTEQKVTEPPLQETSQEVEKVDASLPDAERGNAQKPSLITTSQIAKPVKSEEISQNPIASQTPELAESATSDGTEQTILPPAPNPQLQLDFGSKKSLILMDTDPIKAKRGASKEVTVKARIFDWSKINVSKMAIGSLGEELVLKFEEERLTTLGLGKSLAKIEHSSKVRGDGLGYDILSFDETMNSVFIEVKATTGGFWNGIVFTKNEIEFMNSCGKAYRLYRIFEINKAAKTGKICTFSGSKAVNEFFNFVPQSFSAKPK